MEKLIGESKEVVPNDELTNDEAEVIGADGRDGRGVLTTGNLTEREKAVLTAYRAMLARQAERQVLG